jgi:hypothetical protein
MLTKNDFGFFPILKTSSIIVEDVSNEVPQDLPLPPPLFPPLPLFLPLPLPLPLPLTLPLPLRLRLPLPLPPIPNPNPEQVLQDRIQALHQQAERHTERIEAQLEAQRSEMLELQRGGNNEPV